MAQIFTSDWEGAGVTDGGAWTESGTGSLTRSTSSPLLGTASLLHNGGGGHSLQKSLATTPPICGMRFMVKISAQDRGMTIAQFYNGGPGAFMDVVIVTATNAFGFQYNDSTGSIQSIGSNYVFTLGTTYQIEMMHNNGTSCGWKIWDQGGSTLLSSGTATTNVRTINTERVDVGGLDNPGGTQTYTFDALVVDSAGFAGPYSAGSIIGSGAGTSSQSATLVGAGALSGTATGVGFATSLGNLYGSLAGTSTATGSLGIPGVLRGFAYGGWAAGTVVLTWNANTEPNLAGYKIYIGTSSGVYNFSSTRYTSPVNVGLVTTFTFTALTGPTTYYFAITAFNASGQESTYSNEISWTVPDYGIISGNLKGINVISGSGAGTCSVAGVMYNVGALLGNTSGSGTASAFLQAVTANAIAGIVGGTSTATATLLGTGNLVYIDPHGVGTATGTLTGTNTVLVGQADGYGTGLGTMLGSGFLAGVAAGTSTAKLGAPQTVGVASFRYRTAYRGENRFVSQKR